MNTNRYGRNRLYIGLSLAALGLTFGAAAARAVEVQGIITGRSGANMILQTAESPKVVVALNMFTQVEEVDGVFKGRRKQMAMTALIPGLPVQVQASYNAQETLVADSVKFKGNDLRRAMDIQAGLAPTKQQVAANQQMAKANQLQTQQNEQALQRQQQALLAEQQQLNAEQQKVAANKAAIAAANKRFGQLGDYNILGEVTVYFGNGQVKVDPQYVPQLLALAQKGQKIAGYVIQVQGYASAVGSAALNQKLSSERADAVTAILEQQDNIPLTNMLAPGAMGTARQVASDTTAEGQAENRRVVVRILQNKGIAGV